MRARSRSTPSNLSRNRSRLGGEEGKSSGSASWPHQGRNSGCAAAATPRQMPQGLHTCLYRVCWLTVDAANQNDQHTTDDEGRTRPMRWWTRCPARSSRSGGRTRSTLCASPRATSPSVTTTAGSRGRTENTFIAGWRTVGPIGHSTATSTSGGRCRPCPRTQAGSGAARGRIQAGHAAALPRLPRCYPNATGGSPARSRSSMSLRLDSSTCGRTCTDVSRWDAFNARRRKALVAGRRHRRSGAAYHPAASARRTGRVEGLPSSRCRGRVITE